ncbi:MAG: PadR family transcriptional regulator [Planctomycetes bacterium]|nr:PadR family transcriptional regulator [Planctomycetota bacterium]
MADSRAELLQGTLHLLILKALERGPLHGYAIVRRIEDTSDAFLRVEEGSLYPALHRMERHGWIESEWGLSESNRRAKFYELTSSGRRQLREEQTLWERTAKAIDGVLRAQPKGA